MLCYCAHHYVFPSPVTILPAKMRAGVNVSSIRVRLVTYPSVNLRCDPSICLVVIHLLAEAPHDIKYYWKFVPYSSFSCYATPHFWTHRMAAWVDLSLMSLTFFSSIIWDVEVGIVVSVIVSLLLVVHRSSKTRMTILVCIRFAICPLGFWHLIGPDTRNRKVETH